MALEAQALFFRRRHQPRRPPLATAWSDSPLTGPSGPRAQSLSQTASLQYGRAQKSQLIPPNFDEFSACADTESIIGGVVRVSVLVTPLGILLVGYMLTDRPRDQNDGCANDESPSYQRFHFCPASRRPIVGEAAPSIIGATSLKCELFHMKSVCPKNDTPRRRQKIARAYETNAQGGHCRVCEGWRGE